MRSVYSEAAPVIRPDSCVRAQRLPSSPRLRPIPTPRRGRHPPVAPDHQPTPPSPLRLRTRLPRSQPDEGVIWSSGPFAGTPATHPGASVAAPGPARLDDALPSSGHHPATAREVERHLRRRHGMIDLVPSAGTDAPLRLSPSLQRRAVTAAYATFAALLSAAIATRSSGAVQIGAASVVAICAWIAICAGRQAVLITDSNILVRGWLWSRRIPRHAVTGMTDWPAIRWSKRGRDRWTPIHAFYQPGPLPKFAPADRDNLARLRAVIREG